MGCEPQQTGADENPGYLLQIGMGREISKQFRDGIEHAQVEELGQLLIKLPDMCRGLRQFHLYDKRVNAIVRIWRSEDSCHSSD